MAHTADCAWALAYFYPALAFLLLSMLGNAVLVYWTTSAHLNYEKARERAGLNAVFMMLSCTSPDVMAVLPWDDTQDANGFPTDSAYKWAGRLKAIEDYPLVVIQCAYAMNNPEHINPTTIMSLVMSGLSVIWQFLVRFFLGGGGRAQSEPGIAMSNI